MSTTTMAAEALEAPAAGPRITEPGVYEMSLDEYHADPVPGGSLSSTGARKLLPPSCPALYRHEQDAPKEPRKTFEMGHAAHRRLLGEGPELILVDAARWDTKLIKARLAEIRAAGNVPLKRPDLEQVDAMAAALAEHPVAGRLFRPGRGKAEQSLFWQDQRTGVWCRARPDWTPNRGPGQRLILVDYKTTTDASPEGVQRAVAAYGYHQQAAWYLAGAKALGLHGDGDEPGFVFVFQEKTAPYLVSVVELDFPALVLGAARNERALNVYRECRESGRWPGYSDRIQYLSLPPYAEKRDHEEYM
ncbi:PD-(D/E)XK nuclease-like domain-containing protein [Streptomyces pseudogriseolus]|uniref:PD-(D/E)XK nuclease-like domain-containing protein n=1 Tax=Streptomyces pseudogriseolus TaxID=36817 RepID=UPI003FA3277A